jgi:hypothetical protein
MAPSDDNPFAALFSSPYEFQMPMGELASGRATLKRSSGFLQEDHLHTYKGAKAKSMKATRCRMSEAMDGKCLQPILYIKHQRPQRPLPSFTPKGEAALRDGCHRPRWGKKCVGAGFKPAPTPCESARRAVKSKNAAQSAGGYVSGF